MPTALVIITTPPP